jgi:exopolysaccharide biosynthesis polyprenyl glycosylphosphotransferase
VWGESVTVAATPQLAGNRDIPDPTAAPTAEPRGATQLPDPDDTGDPRALLVRYQRMAFAADLCSALFGAVFALVVRFAGHPSPLHLILSGVIPLVWVVVVALQRGYERRFLGTGPEEYRRVSTAGLLLFTSIAVASYSLPLLDIARGYVVLVVPATVLTTLYARHRLRHWVFKLRAAGRGLQRVLVVGRADAAVAMIEKLDHEPQHGLVTVGACVPAVGVDVSHVHGVPVVGDPSRVLQAVDQTQAHVVAVVSHPDMSGQALRRLSWALEERDVELIVSPGIIEVAGPRLSIRPIAGLSLLHLERPAASGGRLLGKTAFDRLVGGAILLLALPFMLAVGAAIRLTSKGPAMFRQTRVGVEGREFTMYKFRSMVMNAESRRDELIGLSDGNGVLFKMRDDPRVTKVGKVIRRFSVDELPQLINVVRGDMSLVGPRPPLPEEVAGYSSDATRRLRVRPGVTGLWQVSGRSDLSWEESLRLDLRYADNWSLALDLSILWRTAQAVLRGSGAY